MRRVQRNMQTLFKLKIILILLPVKKACPYTEFCIKACLSVCLLVYLPVCLPSCVSVCVASTVFGENGNCRKENWHCLLKDAGARWSCTAPGQNFCSQTAYQNFAAPNCLHTGEQRGSTQFFSILLYAVLLYSVLLYFALFLHYSILFYSNLLYSTTILLYLILILFSTEKTALLLFYATLHFSILVNSVLLYFTLPISTLPHVKGILQRFFFSLNLISVHCHRHKFQCFFVLKYIIVEV